MTVTIACLKKELKFNGRTYPCRIGREGYIEGIDGREGDEKTPLGDYSLRFGLYRADRLPKPVSPLTFRALKEDDGWCDCPQDPAYNRLVRLPYPASCENLWRDTGVYDIILVMSHNDSPPEPGLGSAVFIHIARSDDKGTLGCIALEPEIMVQLLPGLNDQTSISIQA